MTVDSHTMTVQMPGLVQLSASTAQVTLNKSWAPYVQASIVIPKPARWITDALDPRDRVRVQLELQRVFGQSDPVSAYSADWAGLSLGGLSARYAGKALRDITAEHYRPWNSFGARSSQRRSMDLLLRARPIDHGDGTLTLTLASDESLLQDYRLVADAPYAPAMTSVRAITEQVLSMIGAFLAPGDADGTVAVDASTWTPGQAAWDYLQPMVQQAGLRLWCDEMRVWRLESAGQIAAGQLRLAIDGTITAATDDIQRDADDWADAVVITYRWTDAAGAQHTQVDWAAEDGYSKVMAIEYPDTVYPGPGAARHVLDRALGKGRVQAVTAVSDYTAGPQQPIALSLPDADQQNGVIDAITWRLPDAEMDVTTSGLVNVPPTAYLFGPAGVHYLDVPAGIHYPDFDWSDI